MFWLFIFGIIIVLFLIFLVNRMNHTHALTKQYLSNYRLSFKVNNDINTMYCYPNASPLDAMWGQIDLITGRCILPNVVNRRFCLWNNTQKVMKVVYFGGMSGLNVTQQDEYGPIFPSWNTVSPNYISRQPPERYEPIQSVVQPGDAFALNYQDDNAIINGVWQYQPIFCVYTYVNPDEIDDQGVHFTKDQEYYLLGWSQQRVQDELNDYKYYYDNDLKKTVLKNSEGGSITGISKEDFETILDITGDYELCRRASIIWKTNDNNPTPVDLTGRGGQCQYWTELNTFDPVNVHIPFAKLKFKFAYDCADNLKEPYKALKNIKEGYETTAYKCITDANGNKDCVLGSYSSDEPGLFYDKLECLNFCRKGTFGCSEAGWCDNLNEPAPFSTYQECVQYYGQGGNQGGSAGTCPPSRLNPPLDPEQQRYTCRDNLCFVDNQNGEFANFKECSETCMDIKPPVNKWTCINNEYCQESEDGEYDTLEACTTVCSQGKDPIIRKQKCLEDIRLKSERCLENLIYNYSLYAFDIVKDKSNYLHAPAVDWEKIEKIIGTIIYFYFRIGDIVARVIIDVLAGPFAPELNVALSFVQLTRNLLLGSGVLSYIPVIGDHLNNIGQQAVNGNDITAMVEPFFVFTDVVLAAGGTQFVTTTMEKGLQEGLKVGTKSVVMYALNQAYTEVVNKFMEVIPDLGMFNAVIDGALRAGGSLLIDWAVGSITDSELEKMTKEVQSNLTADQFKRFMKAASSGELDGMKAAIISMYNINKKDIDSFVANMTFKATKELTNLVVEQVDIEAFTIFTETASEFGANILLDWASNKPITCSKLLSGDDTDCYTKIMKKITNKVGKAAADEFKQKDQDGQLEAIKKKVLQIADEKKETITNEMLGKVSERLIPEMGVLNSILEITPQGAAANTKDYVFGDKNKIGYATNMKLFVNKDLAKNQGTWSGIDPICNAKNGRAGIIITENMS